MAALQNRNGSYRVFFEYQRKQRVFTVGRVTEAEAKSKADQVDYLLMRLSQGLIELPTGVGIVEFVRQDGKVILTKDGVVTPAAKLTLGSLRDRYLETHGNGTLEERTLDGIRLHFKHLVAALGEAFPIGDLALSDLQSYVDRRAKAKGIRGELSPATIRKEIVTLRTTWNWGVKMDLVAGKFPNGGLRYPKMDAKPPFQTRTEIERQIPGLPAKDQAELWDALYLRVAEVEDLLAHVRGRSGHPWILPLLATAAYTGARRSELLRVRIADVDFEGSVLTIREKKRSHSERTTRRVPLSSNLASVLKEWIADHPGGPWLFCQAGEVERSKKRSRTTRHQSGDGRAKTLGERMKSVRNREGAAVTQLTKDEASDHFKRALADSPWSVVRGFHTLRHSFISACASRGVDQRLIQEWVGHLTAEVHKRYSHLYPSVQSEAIKSVFG
ncbi:MAG: tyrosine-type recombinase/integrase [Paludisphaera borealis]|uniref:tyrosine-type recombinase/integrase n=1 Tax=Paludisphaera borealis TaxID=1387353 RepID=UPI0028449F01|nr:tyrosine-type recombinase/integrase [Paludisphaera borealis]MDR3620915.1 tyrosine-type recombinase/integrase [Paludisphaera borealis]